MQYTFTPEEIQILLYSLTLSQRSFDRYFKSSPITLKSSYKNSLSITDSLIQTLTNQSS